MYQMLIQSTVIGSDADYNARKRLSRRWEYQCAPADFPPADIPPTLVRKPTSDGTRSNVDNDESTDKCEHEEWIDQIFHYSWICDNHQHGWGNSDMQIYNSLDFADCLQPEDGNGAPTDFPPADVPPVLVQKPTSDMTRSIMDNDENTEKCEHEEWIDRKFDSPSMCDNHQHGWRNSDLQMFDNMDIADCLQPEDGNSAPADVPPALIRKPRSDITRSNIENDENPGKGAHEEWIDRKFHYPWICDNHQYGWRNSDLQIYDNMDIADCLQPEKGNCLSYAVCDDSVALMPLIQIIRALFSDGGDMAGRSGHDSDDDGSPAGLLGYLPRCLYWPWSLHGMTQCQVEIKGPSANRLSRVMVYAGGLWDMWSSVTRPVTHAETRW